MKRLWISCVLCVLVMVIATSSASAALHNFGTATTDLYDTSVQAYAPNIQDWAYSLETEQAPILDVEVICEFEDHSNSQFMFQFTYLLNIELWQVNPPQIVEQYDFDVWNVYDDTANWGNGRIHSNTLSITIDYYAPGTYQYKCILEVHIWNYKDAENTISAEASDTWWITMAQ